MPEATATIAANTLEDLSHGVSLSLVRQKEEFLRGLFGDNLERIKATAHLTTLASYQTRYEHDENGLTVIEEVAVVPVSEMKDVMPKEETMQNYPSLVARVYVRTKP